MNKYIGNTDPKPSDENIPGHTTVLPLRLLLSSVPFIKQIFRFGIVGLSAAIIHFSTVVYLVQTLTFDPLLANIFGFILAFQMSYWGHRLWTFNATETLHRAALPKLLFIQIICLIANEFLFYIFLMLNIPYPIALFFVLAILPVFTFASSKLWVFR